MKNHTKIYPATLSLMLAFLMFMFAESALAITLTSEGKTAPMLTSPTSKSLGIAATPPKLYKATPKVYYKTIGNHGHAWWQWAFNFSEAENPLLQNGDVNCSAGQSGKVWYLAGSFAGPAERTCSIPINKAIFFPILNSIAWDYADEAEAEQMRA